MEGIRRASGRALVAVGEALGLTNIDPEPGTIFVTGGSGVIGHRVATRLLKAGYPMVRLGTRNQESLEELNKMGAEIADFSWNDESTYEKALKGVKSVLLTIPYTQMWYKRFPAFLEACKKAGVKHFVKISFYHASKETDELFQEIPLVREHGECDNLLIDMIQPDIQVMPFVMGPDVDVIATDVNTERPKMSYTILYASHLMSNPFIFQGHELHQEKSTPATIFGASHNHGVNYVSPNDVAEVAVRCLMAPCDHFNKEYTLTGPSAITDEDVAQCLSKYLHKPIMYVDQPLDEFGVELQMSGDPKWMVADLVAIEKVKASGAEEDAAFVSEDIETICGHKPESFEEYLLSRQEEMTAAEAGPPSELKPLKPTISA